MLPVYKTPLNVFNYDDIPSGYYYTAMHEGKPVQRFWHQEKFKAVASKITDGQRVLDIGCGPGSFLSILGELCPKSEAIGIDIANGQIDFAMKEIAPRFDGRIKFQRIQGSDPVLPFETASFDAITSIEVIEHIHPFLGHKILQEAKRLLKPDGRMIVTTPNYRSFWPLLEVLLEMLSPVKYHEQHINKFTPNSLVKFLESVGFHVAGLESFFVAAPFFAGKWPKFAQELHSIERQSHKIGVNLGSLLMAVCEKNPNFP